MFSVCYRCYRLVWCAGPMFISFSVDLISILWMHKIWINFRVIYLRFMFLFTHFSGYIDSWKLLTDLTTHMPEPEWAKAALTLFPTKINISQFVGADESRKQKKRKTNHILWTSIEVVDIIQSGLWHEHNIEDEFRCWWGWRRRQLSQSN